ncbi:hypothetical protein HPB47_017913 [Ixodes persulcatus]|uniref:Uncharacterized protein n=1 Tax=Ixodes persulcatus TaxID=34615 RepID=A0AC60QQM9_IXOPE|nr:hypothetical protein HPB47_017913 [Ixodes persulcatus]
MGAHNTWDEIAEAVRISQLERLRRTTTGRTILKMHSAGMTRKPNHPPLPRHMHPICNTERREKRGEALIRRIDLMDSKSVAYVDAASVKSGAAVASVVDGRGAPVSAATIRSRNAETAEEVSIALACLNKKISLIWTPAHTSVPGNEAALELARALYFRVTVEPPDCRNMEERLQNYTEIVENYRLQRKQVPPPDKTLSNLEAAAWRRLQTGNFINPVWAYHVQIDDRQNDKCKHWAKSNKNCREVWEALLRSEVSAPQQQVIRLAEEAAKSQDVFACF